VCSVSQYTVTLKAQRIYLPVIYIQLDPFATKLTRLFNLSVEMQKGFSTSYVYIQLHSFACADEIFVLSADGL
jgi:hypothetical protein